MYVLVMERNLSREYWFRDRINKKYDKLRKI